MGPLTFEQLSAQLPDLVKPSSPDKTYHFEQVKEGEFKIIEIVIDEENSLEWLSEEEHRALVSDPQVQADIEQGRKDSAAGESTPVSALLAELEEHGRLL